MNFHHELDIFHLWLSFETLATPHSTQRAFSRDVINPQFGHILCDPNTATCGLDLRIHWSSRVINSTISRPRKMLALMIETFLGESCAKPYGTTDSLKSLRWEDFRWTGLGQKT